MLRDDWRFSGYVTSDCGGIDDFWQRDKADSTAEDAAANAVLHGTDVECGKITCKSLVKAVKDGELRERDLDVS